MYAQRTSPAADRFGPARNAHPRPAAAGVRSAAGAVADAAASPDARASERRNALVSARATILVVDDEPDVREVLEEYFASHGYEPIGAASADDAKAIVAERPVDLALVDIHMGQQSKHERGRIEIALQHSTARFDAATSGPEGNVIPRRRG